MNIGTMMAFVIISILMAVGIKSISPSLSSTISIALCIVIIAYCVSGLKTILEVVRRIADNINIDRAYIVALIKMIGVAYICEFAAGISKDAGYSAVASYVELAGKLTMLLVSLPVLMQVIETISGIM